MVNISNVLIPLIAKVELPSPPENPYGTDAIQNRVPIEQVILILTKLAADKAVIITICSTILFVISYLIIRHLNRKNPENRKNEQR